MYVCNAFKIVLPSEPSPKNHAHFLDCSMPILNISESSSIGFSFEENVTFCVQFSSCHEGGPQVVPNCNCTVVVNGGTTVDHQETIPNHQNHRGRGSDVEMCETSSLGSYGSVMLACHSRNRGERRMVKLDIKRCRKKECITIPSSNDSKH